MKMKRWISRVMALALAMTMIIGMNMSALAATSEWTFNNLKQGEQVRAYKLFDRKEKANTTGADGATSYDVSYTLNEKYAAFFSRSGGACEGLSGDQLSIAAYQYVAALATEDQTAARSQFAADMWKWILDKNIMVDSTQTVAEGSTSVTLSLDPGYYLMYPTGANVVDGTTAKSPAILKDISGRETDADRTLAIKSTYPTVEKKIVPTTNASGITLQQITNDNWETIHQLELGDDETDEEDSFAPYGAADEKSATDLAIGDTVTYQLTSKVPDMTGYTSYTYKFKDTLSKGLDLKEVLSVYVGTSKLEAKKSGANTYALAYDTATRTLTITFNDCINTFKSHVGETITVKYSATLNKDAVVGTDPNTNKVKVEYSNNPKTNGTGESEETNAKVYTFGFDIYKYTLKDITGDDNDSNRVSLKGAQFKLYKDNGGTKGDPVKLMKNGDGIYYQDDTTTSPVEYVETTADGKLTIKGLKEGTYYLEETKAPAGYNGLKGEIKVEITNVKYDENDKTKLTSYDVIYTMPGAATGTTVTVSTNDMTDIPVLNKAGVILPSTGGRGSMAFTVIGVIIIGAMMASSLMSKKRKSAE